MDSITKEEWIKLDTLAKLAKAALDALGHGLNNLHVQHITDEKVNEFVCKVQDRLADGRFVVLELQLQSQWTGGDSREPKNFILREPNAVFDFLRRNPRPIPGTQGKG